MKNETLSAWIQAIRPYSLGNSVILILIASALANAAGHYHQTAAVLCLIFALLMQCTSNLVNDLFDTLKGADREDRLGPERPSAKGTISPKAMKWGIALFTTAACIVGLCILGWALENSTLVYGGWELVVVGLSCVIFAYLYTAGPWALSYHGLGDIAVILFFGLIPIGFTYYIMTGEWTSIVTISALACGLVIDTMLMINNFRDREEDLKSNKRTLVVRFGKEVGKWGYLALGVMASLLCFSLLWRDMFMASILPQIYLVAHIRTWDLMVKIDHGEQLNLVLGKTARNILLFGALFAIGIMLH